MNLKRRIFVNQSQATIRINHVDSLTVNQIGGTIDNSGSENFNSELDPEKTSKDGENIDIMNWEDVEQYFEY